MARARGKSVGATDLNGEIIVPDKKNQEVLVLGLTFLITGSLLAGGSWYALKSGILDNKQASTEQIPKANPQAKTTLNA